MSDSGRKDVSLIPLLFLMVSRDLLLECCDNIDVSVH